MLLSARSHHFFIRQQCRLLRHKVVARRSWPAPNSSASQTSVLPDCGSRPLRVWDPSLVDASSRCSLLLSCQVSSHYGPRRRLGGFRAPLSSLALDCRGDEAELTREERNLVRRLLRRWGRGRRYRAESGGQVTVDETSAWPCRPSRPHPAPPARPSRADLKDVSSECSAQQRGCVLTFARGYRVMAFRSISVHTWSQRPEDTRVLPLAVSACSSPSL